MIVGVRMKQWRRKGIRLTVLMLTDRYPRTTHRERDIPIIRKQSRL